MKNGIVKTILIVMVLLLVSGQVFAGGRQDSA